METASPWTAAPASMRPSGSNSECLAPDSMGFVPEMEFYFDSM